MYFNDKLIFMEAWGFCEPARSVADWSCPLRSTYLPIRKTPRPEIGTSLTVLASGSEDIRYSGQKVRNLANVWKVLLCDNI